MDLVPDKIGGATDAKRNKATLRVQEILGRVPGPAEDGPRRVYPQDRDGRQPLGGGPDPGRDLRDHKEGQDHARETPREHKGVGLRDLLQGNEGIPIIKVPEPPEEPDRHDRQEGEILSADNLQQLPADGAKTQGIAQRYLETH